MRPADVARVLLGGVQHPKNRGRTPEAQLPKKGKSNARAARKGKPR